MNKFTHWFLYEEEIFGNVVLTAGFKILAIGIMLWVAVHINWGDQLESFLGDLGYYTSCHTKEGGC